MNECLAVHWVGTFVRDGKTTKDFTLNFQAATTADVTATISNYCDRMQADGWYLRGNPHLRVLRVVNRE